MNLHRFAEGEHAHLGWTIDPTFLRDIKERAAEICIEMNVGTPCSLEDIEAIVLALIEMEDDHV